MKRTKRSPFVFRLMLSSLFLPIFILLTYAIILMIMNTDHSEWDASQVIGVIKIPTPWFAAFLVTFPFLLGIWLFRSGQWRLPVFITGTVYFGVFLLDMMGYLENYVPPEKRMIYLTVGGGFEEETDIYCNGVYLGQTPLEIRVGELMAKVPEWTNPPEQQWYFENPGMCYTWLPWDDFRSKERFLETKNLLTSETPLASSPASRKKQASMYNTGCRYWWRFENNKSPLFLQRDFSVQYYHNQAFEKINNYHYNSITVFSPSTQIHAWLLFNILGELTELEKNDWDRHVLKNWSSLHNPLTQYLTAKYRSKNPDDSHFKIFETALDSIARLKYGLSDPPTEEECRKLLTKWVNESNNNISHYRQTFYLSHSYPRILETEFYNDVDVNSNERPLINAAIRLMGKAIQKPLVEQWEKDYYRYANGWSPLIYLANTDQGAEYFDNFVRYFATTHNGRWGLLENQNEHTIPLFRTFLFQKTFLDLISNDNALYHRDKNRIDFYNHVKNPLLEPVFFEYMTYALSRPKLSENYRNELSRLVFILIFWRIDREVINKEELSVKVASLPIPQRFKDILIQKIQMKSDGIKSFSDLLQQAAGVEMFIKTKKTAEDVNRWFAENPEGTLDTFFQAFENDFELNDGIVTIDSRGENVTEINGVTVTTPLENIFGNTKPLYSPNGQFIGTDIFKRCLVSALLKTNTPETQKTMKQICNNPKDLRFVLSAIGGETVQKILNNTYYTNTNPYFDPIAYLDISIECPDYLFDALEKSKSEEVVGESPASLILVYCSLPRAEQLLEKWTHTENETLKLKSIANLKHWQKRKEIQEQKKELFLKLVEEKITPDDLLTPQPPWIWKENGYVQVSE